MASTSEGSLYTSKRCDALDAQGEDDELQFHFDPDETFLPFFTLLTFDPYIFDKYNQFESSQPTGYRTLHVGKPRDCPHEPEPCEPNSVHFLWDNLDNSSPNTMAAQAMEALNRTFAELKSKNDETRLRASHDLRDLVVSAARGRALCLLRLSCTC